MHWVYPISNSDSNTMLQAISVSGDIVVYLLSGIGFVGFARRDRRFLPMIIAIGFVALQQTVLHCEARYRLPVMPFMILMAAPAFVLTTDRLRFSRFLAEGNKRLYVIVWVLTVTATYAFTAWQVVSGKIT
jgi:hypothetical protein